MSNKSRTIVFYGLLIAVAAGLIFLSWANYAIVENTPAGEYFSVYWNSTRSFLENGESPYSPEVSEQLYIIAKERGYPADPSLHRFVYPLYLQAVILPFAFISNFTTALVGWITFLELSLLLTAWFGIQMTGWRTGAPLFILFGFFVLFNYLSASQLYGGSIIIVEALLITLSFFSLRKGWDEVAGLLLALTTILPFTALPLVLFVLFWGITAGRPRLIAWLGGSLILMIGAGILALRDWPFQFVELLHDQPSASYYQTPAQYFQGIFPGLGTQLGWALAGFAGLILLIEWWAARRKEFRWFLWTACLTITLTPWLGLPYESGHVILLLLPLLLIYSKLEERWGLNSRTFLLVSLVVLFALTWLPFAWNLPESLIARTFPGLMLASPLLVLVLLYWVRWWAVRPRRTMVAELMARDDF